MGIRCSASSTAAGPWSRSRAAVPTPCPPARPRPAPASSTTVTTTWSTSAFAEVAPARSAELAGPGELGEIDVEGVLAVKAQLFQAGAHVGHGPVVGVLARKLDLG